MKKGMFGLQWLLIGICFLAVVFTPILFGCGQQSSTTTTVPGSVLSISGTLKAGTISSSGPTITSTGAKIQAVAYGAIPSYNVVVVSKNTGKIYFASDATSSTGSFTIPNLPAGESFYVAVLDDANKLAAPVAMGTAGGKAMMALASSTSNISLGDIAYDSSKGGSAPVTEPTTLLDSTASVDPKSGESLVPKGASNFGKGTTPQISSGYDATKIDGDKDGLPNIVDADNNGDNVVDELDGLYTMEALSSSQPNFYSYAFTNLKIDWNDRNTFNQNYSNFTIAIGVTQNSKGGFTPKTIQGCKVIKGPAWLTKAYIIPTSGPSTLWSASNYELPLKSSNVYEAQIGGQSPTYLKPGTDVTAGDTLKIQVNFTDGTSEESIKMINFVFTDIPRVIAYKIGSSAWATSLTDGSFPASASTSEITVRWTRPKDETSQEVIGGKYTYEYNTTAGVVTETTVITKDADSTLTSLEAYVDYAKLTNAKYESNNQFMIGVCIRSEAGDNSAENIRFTKTW